MAITKIQSESLNLADTYAFTGTVTGAAANTPAFLAYRTSTQSSASGAATKIQYDTELFDTDNCYDNSTNYRFTPTVAGHYFIFASTGSTASSDFEDHQVRIHRNGSEYGITRLKHHYGDHMTIQGIVYFNGSTDYVEIFNYNGSGSSININGADRPQVRFGGYRILE